MSLEARKTSRDTLLKRLFAGQTADGQIATAVLESFRKQAGRLGAGGINEGIVVAGRIGQILELENVHILDGNVVFGANIDGALGAFKFKTFHGGDQSGGVTSH